MDRRQLLKTAMLAGMPAALGACGGGSSDDAGPGATITRFEADKSAYLIGETARLTGVFSGGTGRIDPGNIAVTSGTAVTVTVSRDTTFQLTVTPSVGAATSQSLVVPVAYANSFTAVPLGAPRDDHRQVIANDGAVLVFGGEDASSALPTSVLRLDPATLNASVRGNLTTGRTGHTATALLANQVLVYGGVIGLTAAPIAELFDVASGSSRSTTISPANPRIEHTATLLPDGQVLVVGGRNGNAFLDTADLYDPASDSFTRLVSRLGTGRSAHVAVPLGDGRVLIYGGLTLNGRPAPPELYDHSLRGFTTFALPAFELDSRLYATAVRLASGDVLVIGGETAASDPLASVVRVQAGSSLTFVASPALASPRTRAAAVLLTDGRTLVTGGSVTPLTRGVATTELIAATGAVTAGPPMTTGRVLHAASVLPSSGKVLMTGGVDANHSLLSSVDVFA